MEAVRLSRGGAQEGPGVGAEDDRVVSYPWDAAGVSGARQDHRSRQNHGEGGRTCEPCGFIVAHHLDRVAKRQCGTARWRSMWISISPARLFFVIRRPESRNCARSVLP